LDHASHRDKVKVAKSLLIDVVLSEELFIRLLQDILAIGVPLSIGRKTQKTDVDLVA
jgi:hypothetical protein